MWTMGYSDGGEFNSTQDPFTGRKLRPLMPRSATAASSTGPPAACLTRIHGADLLAANHHLAATVEMNKREHISTQQVVVSPRWNPTPEQLQTLEELYRRGTRTPSAEQIQHIAAQLRRYGKIEGKNVFYWFQNHKARERQKRRRQLESAAGEQKIGAKRELPAGANRTAFEVEQTKNWASPTNSSTAAEKTGSSASEGAAKAAEAEYKAKGWAQFDDGAELQQGRRNATWQMMHLSCSSSARTANLIISASPTVTCAIPSTVGTMETIPFDQGFASNFSKPYDPTNLGQSNHGDGCYGFGGEEAQTLQLFPLQGGSRQCQNAECASVEEEEEEEEEEESDVAMNGSTASDLVTPYQFFEFLPLKN